MKEMRLAIARILLKFRVTPSESYSAEKFKEDWRDYFTAKIASLPLVFEKREG
jgi:hypothetical protein